MDLIILFVSGFLGFLLTWLTATGKIVDGRRRGWNWINNRGWMVAICGFLTLILIVVQYLINQNNEARSKALAQIEQRQRDSTNTANVIHNFTTALAHYGLKYDSSQQIIRKLILDSLKRTNVVTTEAPFVFLCSGYGLKMLSFVNGVIDIELSLCNYGGPATDLEFTVTALLKEPSSGKIKILPESRTLKNIVMPPNTSISRTFFIGAVPLKTELIYFHIKGTYRSSYNKSFSLVAIGLYIINENKYQLPDARDYSEIQTLLSK